MHVFRQRVNALFSGAVDEIRGAGGDLRPEDIAWLWDLSKSAVELGRDIPEQLSLPVQVGPVVLHPHTIGAILWWRAAAEWFEDGPETVLAMAWMLAHCAPENDGAAFKSAGNRRRARAAVWWWTARLPLNLTLARLDAAVAAVLGIRDGEFLELRAPGERPPGSPPTVSDYGRFIIRLCALRHLKPDDVRWRMSATDAFDLAKADAEGHLPDDSGTREYAALRAAVQHLKPKPPPEAAP